MSKELKLGMTLRDTLTGFTGIAAARVEMLDGNIQLAIQPYVGADTKTGEMPGGMNIDIHTLEYVSDGISDRATTPNKYTIAVGDKVRDTVTGIEGIAIDRIVYLNGCVYYNVQQTKVTDRHTGVDTVPDRIFTMQARLEVVTPSHSKVEKSKPSKEGRVPGGPSTRAQRA